MITCAVQGCKTSTANKTYDVNFYPIPSNQDLRSKWLVQLKNKCSVLDLNKSRICSKHFEKRFFDSLKRLRENYAVPTIFPRKANASNSHPYKMRTRVDKMLSNMTHTQLANEVKYGFQATPEPVNLSDFVNDDCTIEKDAPMEAKLWLLIKKQEYLIDKLSVHNNNTKVQMQKALETAKSEKIQLEKTAATLKYIVKGLQEKQATLEEQIEILTAVETR